MARFYDLGPSADELALIGITAEDIGDLPPCEVWEENWKTLTIFTALDSQWRVGFNGRTGLDYVALPVIFDLYGVKKRKRGTMFRDIRLMEQAALKIFHKQQQ